MANSVRLESGWLFRQLESAEQRAGNLPYWLSQPISLGRSEPPASDRTPPNTENEKRSSE